MLFKQVLCGINTIEEHADMNIEITGITYDSRSVKPGNVFVAITGFKSDGHKYIDKAIELGASAVICERKPESDIPYVIVDDCRVALSQASANFYGHPSKRVKVIGVTGTNGKTTVTNLIKHILEANGEKVGLIGTNRNMIGERALEAERTTPESSELQELFKEMADEGCTYIVMEVSSHSLVLSRVHGIQFELGVYTNISQDHLDFHGTMEEYARAKSLLFKSANRGIINVDDERAQVMLDASDCEMITYGITNAGADICAKNIKLKERSVEFEALCLDSLGRIEFNVPGKFSVYNALAAISACLCCGVELEVISKALANVSGVKGRAEIVPTDTDYTVMIDYAHTPDGLINILSTVHGFAKGKVWVVFGCGGDRDATKRPLMGEVASRLADYVVVTSDNPRTEDPQKIIDDILPGITKPRDEYHVEADRVKAVHYAMKNARAGDVIVLAGKGHETYQEINGVKLHMDEREIVADYLSNLT